MIWRILLGAIGGFFFDVAAWAVVNSGADVIFGLSYRWVLPKPEETFHTLLIVSLGGLAGFCWHMLTLEGRTEKDGNPNGEAP